MDPKDRARAWLAKVPYSVSGSGGHAQAFIASVGLVNGFALDPADAFDLLSEWNRGCQPPWTERELTHKILQAGKVPHNHPKGHLLRGSVFIEKEKQDIKNFVVKKPKPVTIKPSGSESHVEFIEFLKAAFAENEIICICNDLTDEGKPNSSGSFLTRDQWIQKFGMPESTLLSKSGNGAFIRINPFSPGDFTGSDKAVSSYRHVLVEMDSGSKVDQEKLLVDSGLPITALIDSGGKSIHAWVRVDASDRKQWDERRDVIYNAMASKGIDPKNKNPSRYSRLPGAHRDGQSQRLLALHVGAESYENWMADCDTALDTESIVSVDDLITFDSINDPNNLVGNRWLVKGSSMIISGGSGIGKSSLVMQLIMQWGLGRGWFELYPDRPLKIGVIQAENDTGDLAEAFQGVAKGLNLADSDKEKLKEQLLFRTETVRTGDAFLDYARRFISKSKLDMLIADPLLSYFGGDLSDQEAVSIFLRNKLQPILKETGVCWIWMHHIAKPAKEREEAPTLMELAYSGFGSSELTNWAREIAVIQEHGHFKPRKFKIAFCKRGGRLKEPVIPIGHSATGILWERWNPLEFTIQRPSGQSRRPRR